MATGTIELTPPYTPVLSQKESFEDVEAQLEHRFAKTHAEVVTEQQTRLHRHVQSKKPVHVDTDKVDLASVVAVSR